MIFLLVVGASFWADIKKRIDITITVMLATAALYLVIGETIPSVGYMSTFDWFISSTFIILGFLVALHCLSQMLSRKKLKYPIMRFEADLLINICRVAWLPAMLGMFISLFELQTSNSFLIPLILACIFAAIYGMTTLINLKKSFIRSMDAVFHKVNTADTLSNVEIHKNPLLEVSFCERFIHFFSFWKSDDKEVKKGNEMVNIRSTTSFDSL